MGNQDKSVLVSEDGGLTWSHPGGCADTGGADVCAVTSLFGGYLGQIEAVSSSTAFLYGGRSSIRVTTDGGASWSPSELYSTLVSRVIFFSTSLGIAFGDTPSDNNGPTVWHTDDGGTTWTPVIPTVQK